MKSKLLNIILLLLFCISCFSQRSNCDQDRCYDPYSTDNHYSWTEYNTYPEPEYDLSSVGPLFSSGGDNSGNSFSVTAAGDPSDPNYSQDPELGLEVPLFPIGDGLALLPFLLIYGIFLRRKSVK